MIGNGKNIKSVCYVKNLVAYTIHCMEILKSRDLIISNYADKPDITINQLVLFIQSILNIKSTRVRIPYFIAIIIGYIFDLFSLISNKRFNINSLRIKKFCSNSILESNIVESSHFSPVLSFRDSLEENLKSN